MRGDRERLADILEAMRRIKRYTRGGRATLDDELVQTWVVHNLEILGEAARGVSGHLRERHTGLPWREMVGMRNVLAHGYFGIDVERVWGTLERDLPKLERQVASVIAAIDAHERSRGEGGSDHGGS